MEREPPGESLHFINRFLIFLLNFLYPHFKTRLVPAVINSELHQCRKRPLFQFSSNCSSRVCLHLQARFACMPAWSLAGWRRPAASRRAFHVLDGAVRKHRFVPHLSGTRGMSSFITEEKQKTWEVFFFIRNGRQIVRNKGAFKHTESDTVSLSLGRSAKTLGASWC